MGDTDISLGIEEDVEQGSARNQTLRLERLKDPSPAGAVLPTKDIHSKLNPFVLCRVLSQRARQLATRYPGKPFSQVIKMAKAEFRDRKLQYVVPQFSPSASRERKSQRKRALN